MKLIVDNSNVETIPVGNLQDISSCARKFADEVDAGEHGDVVSVTLIIETGKRLLRDTWGEVPTGCEMLGMLAVVQAAIIRATDYED